MSLSEQLAAERRARLAAERQLAQKHAELVQARRELGHHARELSQQISQTRARVATVEDENHRVRSALGKANEKIAMVEGQLWQALSAMRDGFAMWGADGRLELANRAYLSVFDDLAAAAVGAHYTQLIELMVTEGIADLEGAQPEEWRAGVRRGWESEPPPPVTIRLWNGAFIKILNRPTPAGGIVSLVVDMTELMHMWSAVQELPDGFVLYDAEDRLLTCNERYRALYATSAPAMQPGTYFEDILRFGLDRGQYAEAVGREEDWLAQRLAEHRRPESVLEQELDDGRWIRVFEKRTRDGGRVGLRLDITDLKTVQRDLKSATERAEAANRSKSAFLANMSHEIRTPMNGVVGMTEMLLETGLDAEQRLLTETIRNSGEALLAIINDVLDYSKIEAAKLVLTAAPFDLDRVVREVLMLLQPSARDKGLALRADYDLALPTRFVGDGARLRQVLTNLVGNAVKFTAAGQVLVGVAGTPAEDGGMALEITVEDTGIGIPPDKLEHIFGQFNQVQDDRDRRFEGTGLGLAITRRLVGLMDGEVWVSSTVGDGACFGVRVTLPVAEAAAHAMPRLPPGLRRALLVHADGSDAAILARQLSATGIEVLTCRHAAEALAAGDAWDVALLDAGLPAPGWADLGTRLARARPAAPQVLLSPTGTAPSNDAGRVAAVVRTPASRRSLIAALAEAAATMAERDARRGSAGIGARDAVKAVPAPGPGFPADMEGTAFPCFRSCRPAVPAAFTQHPAGRRLDVLLAEDNRTNQLVFSKMLAERDLDLRIANNGAEAVAAVSDKRPDVIFMDISMPGMDGREAARRIRALDPRGPRLPIVAITAHALDTDRAGILAAGLDACLTKPLHKAALLDMLDRHAAWAHAGAETGTDTAAE